MTTEQLEKGNELQSRLREVDRIKEHMEGFREKEDNPIEFLTNFLNGCQMIGNEGYKKIFAKNCIDGIIEYCDNAIKTVETKFKEL